MKLKTLKSTIVSASLMICFLGNAQADQLKVRRADLNGDGSKEANIYYDENDKIVKIIMDKNHDAKTDCTIYYRNGYRDTAEIDANFDGIIDTVVFYYFTGVPASIAVDRNKDGKPDSWTYFQNGFLYKREWDRNFDGIPDYRIIFATKPDYRIDAKTELQKIEKQYDNNYDGVFEKTIKTKKRARIKKISVDAGSLSELAN